MFFLDDLIIAIFEISDTFNNHAIAHRSAAFNQAQRQLWLSILEKVR